MPVPENTKPTLKSRHSRETIVLIACFKPALNIYLTKTETIKNSHFIFNKYNPLIDVFPQLIKQIIQRISICAYVYDISAQTSFPV